jgi:hypothetical protein
MPNRTPEQQSIYHKQLYANNAEWRERKKAKSRERYYILKAQRNENLQPVQAAGA